MGIAFHATLLGPTFVMQLPEQAGLAGVGKSDRGKDEETKRNARLESLPKSELYLGCSGHWQTGLRAVPTRI